MKIDDKDKEGKDED